MTSTSKSRTPFLWVCDLKMTIHRFPFFVA